jgi:flagellar protein FliL
MADKPQAAADTEKPKSKKMLIIIIAAVLLLVIIGGGVAFFLLKKKHADEDPAAADSHAPAAVVHKKPDPKAPPTYLPMDNMVVNLADPGGGRFAQVGITFKLDDVATADAVKLYMPSIRNAILFEISKRTSDELLAVEGKEKLTRSIVREVSAQLGYEVEDEDPEDGAKPAKKRRVSLPPTPVQAVLFSSFIVQ